MSRLLLSLTLLAGSGAAHAAAGEDIAEPRPETPPGTAPESEDEPPSDPPSAPAPQDAPPGPPTEPGPGPPAAAATNAVPSAPDGTAAAVPEREPMQPVEVRVRGAQSEARRLQQSAEAVNVVDLRRAREQTADLGEVLARQAGVSFRRSGGLGSDARFCLAGVCDDGVRLFVDGIPLDLAGYPASGALGLSVIPVGFVERLEIFRGVVPVRFGADALGGAVNLVTDQSYRDRLHASYQVGSFGMHRLSLDGRFRHRRGFVLGASALLDRAANDYPVDVEIPDDRGRLQPARVRRFHDAYAAQGAALEVGVLDEPWARRLLVRGFWSGYDKELQHNVVMTVPYGEVRYGETTRGGGLRYEVALHRTLELQLLGSYAHRAIDYSDQSRWVYDWRGQRIRERRVPGEIESRPRDQTVWEDTVLGRALLTWRPATGHALRLAATPQYATRTGDERIQLDPAGRDPLTAIRDLRTLVSGLEHEAELLAGRLSTAAFVKDYLYLAETEEPLPGNLFRYRKTRRHTQGAGASARYRLGGALYTKASYEYATRLPRPDEVFGNGVLILPNLNLEPEVSHNANLGPRLELRRPGVGELTVDVSAFLRDTDRLIVLLGSDRFFSFQNVYRARGVGVEHLAAWTSPDRRLTVEGMVTWLDLRNASSRGTFGDFEGDRIPNRPYLFGSWSARASLPARTGPDDTLLVFYHGRYVHEFFRGWESVGLREYKQVVPSQLSHACGVTWTIARDAFRLASTAELDNLTDARLYDNFGVQRPGRAFFLKLTAEL